MQNIPETAVPLIGIRFLNIKICVGNYLVKISFHHFVRLVKLTHKISKLQPHSQV